MTDLEKLLSATTAPQLRGHLAGGLRASSPAQALQVAEHARRLAPPEAVLRLAFVHTYTSDLLEPWLAMAAAVQGMEHTSYHAPYGLALTQAQPQSALVAHRPHVTVLMLQREDLAPALARPISGLDRGVRDALRDQCLGQVREWVEVFRAQAVGQLLVTFLPRLTGPGLGLYDGQAEHSDAAWWADFKGRLGQWLREDVPSTLLLDLDDLLAQVGRERFFDSRFWYSARYPFAAAAASELARRVVAIGATMIRPKAKVLVVDADNTLWGGIVGEDGIDGIRLGPEFPGNAYVEFQRRLLDFQQRGFILAMSSKNNARDVDQVLQEHPHMVLRDEHFAARRVNWMPKPDNLASLAEELNLGLDSFIFVDDSDHECAAVRHALPQVEVIQVPARPVDVPACLDHVARLEILSLTREDTAKTVMYAQERLRRELIQSTTSGGGGGDYLERLGMKMTIGLDVAAHVPRLAQLTQKTNQFNLTTRRYDETQVRAFAEDPNWWVADFSLADAFGDSGVVGLLLVRLESPRVAHIDTFLMSCRVIGRKAEQAFLHTLMRRLVAAGIEELSAEFRATAKNDLVKDLLASQGFEAMGAGRWHRHLVQVPPKPESAFPIRVHIESTA